jgi:hypothetical protein
MKLARHLTVVLRKLACLMELRPGANRESFAQVHNVQIKVVEEQPYLVHHFWLHEQSDASILSISDHFAEAVHPSNRGVILSR